MRGIGLAAVLDQLLDRQLQTVSDCRPAVRTQALRGQDGDQAQEGGATGRRAGQPDQPALPSPPPLGAGEARPAPAPPRPPAGGPQRLAARVPAPIEELLFEVKRLIVGQDRLLERLLVALLSGGHVLLEGVPGLAKTATVKAFAEVIGGSAGGWATVCEASMKRSERRGDTSPRFHQAFTLNL